MVHIKKKFWKRKKNIQYGARDVADAQIFCFVYLFILIGKHESLGKGMVSWWGVLRLGLKLLNLEGL